MQIWLVRRAIDAIGGEVVSDGGLKGPLFFFTVSLAGKYVGCSPDTDLSAVVSQLSALSLSLSLSL